MRDELPEHLAFFVDDNTADTPGPSTTLEQWDRKYHRRLFLGLGSENTDAVKDFLLFRQKVGHFPTTPPAWYKPDDPFYHSPTAAAFDEAWEPYRGKFEPIYSNAARVYDAIQSNTFYDKDTRERIYWERFRKRSSRAGNTRSD